MGKVTRGRRGIASRQCRPTPYPLPSYRETDGSCNGSFKLFKKDWEDATCSVCMECPHNAVLLLCSSHEKGCRPYMCGTSFRYSNCLDQYKKTSTKLTSSDNHPHHDSLGTRAVDPFSGRLIENCEATELACPLCRGQVKGWTVVEPAREHLNAKKRSCMQDNCSFTGTFKEMRKHVRATHPSSRPREVDPTLERKWRRLERDQEREDVMSTIRSSMPGARFFGDYVIEGGHYDSDSEDEDGFAVDMTGRNDVMDVGIDRDVMSMFYFLHSIGSAGTHRRRSERGSNYSVNRSFAIFDSDDEDDDDDDDDDDGRNYGTSLAGQGRVLLGRRGGRIRRRETDGSGDRL